MVDLPQLRVNTLTEGARSQVSGGEIRSAYDQFAQGLNAIEDEAARAGIEQSKTEGENAVYRDENGDLQYKPRSNMGVFNIAFNRSAQASYLSQMQGEIQTKLAGFRGDANG